MWAKLVAALVLLAACSAPGLASDEKRYEDGFRAGLETAAKNDKSTQLAYLRPNVLATAVLASYIRHPDCDEFIIGGPYIDGPDFLHPAPLFPFQAAPLPSPSGLAASVTDDLGRRWKVTGIKWQRDVVWKHEPLEWHIDVDGPGPAHSETVVSLPSTADRSDYRSSQTRTYVAGVGWVSSRSYVAGGPQTRTYNFVSFVFARRKENAARGLGAVIAELLGAERPSQWEPVRGSQTRFLTLVVSTPDGEVSLKWDTAAAGLRSQGGIGPALLEEASQDSSHEGAHEPGTSGNARTPLSSPK
jgi:hypothetical protein